MKKIFLLVFPLLLLLAAGCKKEDDNTAITLSGYWKGKYSDTLTTPDKDFGLLFRTNNTVRIYDMSASTDSALATIGEGTYTATKSSVSLQYTFLTTTGVYNATGSLNANMSVISGQYIFTGVSNYTGNFTVTKQ